MSEANQKAGPTNEQQILNVLETISDHQAQISQQLAELLEILTKEPEMPLIEQLSALLQPLLQDVADIKRQTMPTSPAPNNPTVAPAAG